MSDSVTYSIAYKRNLPNYENVTAFFSATKGVSEDETLDSVKAELVTKVDGWLEERINQIDAEVAALKKK